MDQNQMMMDYLLEMGAMQPEQEQLARQRALVDQMRGMSQRSPEMRGNSNVQVAANPLEFLNQGLQSYAAKQMGGRADTAEAAYKRRRLEALGGMRKQWMPPKTGTPGIVPPTGGGSPYGDDPYAAGGW
jgi:hypothetical protein